MAILNPTTIRWTDPTAREDGSAFGASDFLAYELGRTFAGSNEPEPLLTLPTAYGTGLSPIPTVVEETRNEVQALSLRTLDKLGLRSQWTAPIEVVFASRPLAPAGFSAD